MQTSNFRESILVKCIGVIQALVVLCCSVSPADANFNFSTFKFGVWRGHDSATSESAERINDRYDPDFFFRLVPRIKEEFSLSLFESSPGERIRQVGILVRNAELIGMQQEKLHDLLGKYQIGFRQNDGPDRANPRAEWFEIYNHPGLCTIQEIRHTPAKALLLEVIYTDKKVDKFRFVTRTNAVPSS